jgi:hypothetical protein
VRYRQRSRVASLIFVLVVAVAVITPFVMPSRSWYPSRWDPRIEEIAHKVSELRELRFEHPVPRAIPSAGGVRT